MSTYYFNNNDGCVYSENEKKISHTPCYYFKPLGKYRSKAEAEEDAERRQIY